MRLCSHCVILKWQVENRSENKDWLREATRPLPSLHFYILTSSVAEEGEEGSGYERLSRPIHRWWPSCLGGRGGNGLVTYLTIFRVAARWTPGTIRLQNAVKVHDNADYCVSPNTTYEISLAFSQSPILIWLCASLHVTLIAILFTQLTL